jgi:MOSC domain-containing protein YiiM
MASLGTVVSIHRVAVKHGPAELLTEVAVQTDYGIAGDWRSRAHTSAQLTLIEEEALEHAARTLDRPMSPGASRRQVVVRGLPLNPTVGKLLRVGELELEVVMRCDPCDRMERTIGPGARAALEDRGGVRTRVRKGGLLCVGDPVAVTQKALLGAALDDAARVAEPLIKQG